MATALVTDSTAYLEADLRAALPIEVVPLHVVVGGRGRAEGIDIDAAEVAGALRAFTPVSTSRPSPQAFLEVYERLAAPGPTPSSRCTSRPTCPRPSGRRSWPRAGRPCP